MKTYKYILLDWDGNLAKTLDVWLEAYRTVLERHDIHASDEAIAANFGDFPGYLQQLGVANVDAVYEDAHVLARKGLPEVELYPDALAVLAELHAAGKKMALITTSPHRNVDHLLEKYDLHVFFGAVVAGDDVAHRQRHLETQRRQIPGRRI